MIERVLSTGLFEIQDRELARRALADYRRGEAGKRLGPPEAVAESLILVILLSRFYM